MAAVKGQPAPKPGSTPDPVPGQEGASEFNAFMANLPKDSEFGKALTNASQSAEALNGPAQQGNSVVSGAVDMAGRALDYPGGFARAGLAEVAGAAAGKGSIVTPEDLSQAAVGKGPSSEEYLRRLGVGEGGSFLIPGTSMKITQRGADGLALDIATDPLTAIAKLVKAAPYIQKIINLPGHASEALGEAAYRSALKGVDEKLADKGAGKISDIMLQNGAPVGIANVAEKADALRNTMGKVRQGLYDRAAEKGVSIDAGYPLKRTEAVLERMRRDPGLAPAAEELQQLMDRYKSAGKVGIDQVSEWKTNLYDSLPASAFAEHGRLKGQAKQFKAALAADFRDAIIGAGNKAEKGLGDAINAVNERWGTLIQAEGPLAKSGKGGDKLGTMIDGAVLATGGVHASAVKKGFELAVSPAAKQAVGKAFMEAGRNDLMNRLARQSLAQYGRPSQTSPNVDFNSLPTQVQPPGAPPAAGDQQVTEE